MKLLQNSITIKTAQQTSSIEKLKSVMLIQLKILNKYEDFITIVISQMWGNEPRNKRCREYVGQYLEIITKIAEEGIQKNEIKDASAETIAISIFSTTYVSLLYNSFKENNVSINDISKEIQNILFNGLKN